MVTGSACVSFVLFIGMCKSDWFKLMRSVCLRCRLWLDASLSLFENVGGVSGSGVGNLIGDLFPFALWDAVFFCEECDSNFVEVDGLLMGVALCAEVFGRECERVIRYCIVWGVSSV